MKYTPQNPSPEWLKNWFPKSLIDEKGYHIDAPSTIDTKLDQNESPFDWPHDFKKKVLSELETHAWNLYPEPFLVELEKLVAQYCGVTRDNIVLSPGSNYHVSNILKLLGTKIRGKVVFPQPSFPLYSETCRLFAIPYEAWPLNKFFQYDLDLLPSLQPGSVVIFASPNNPVGNILLKKDLEFLLAKHPDVYFIADEAYVEFAGNSYVDLLEKFSNLVMIRTFSKTFSSAGIRLGYVLGSKEFIFQLKKITLPYLINHFTAIAMTTALKSQEIMQYMRTCVQKVIAERERVFHKLNDLSKKSRFEVFNTHANFLLLRFPHDKLEEVYQFFIAGGLLVRNVGRGPALEGCLRLTIGNEQQNQKVLKIMEKLPLLSQE